jgi:hypothetical protein
MRAVLPHVESVSVEGAATALLLFLSADAAIAGQRVCVQCDLPVGELAEKCAPGDQGRALLCINDIFALTWYLEDTKEICRAKKPTIEALKTETLKVHAAIRKEAKKRPRTPSVTVVRDILMRMHPCK